MRNIDEPSLEDIIRHGGNGQQGQGGSMLDMLANHNRSMQSRSLMDNPNIASLVLNALVFGEDEDINGLLQEELARHTLSDYFVEWPWRIPDPNRIHALINIGNSIETGAPVGINPEEVHFFRHRSLRLRQNDACTAHC